MMNADTKRPRKQDVTDGGGTKLGPLPKLPFGGFDLGGAADLPSAAPSPFEEQVCLCDKCFEEQVCLCDKCFEEQVCHCNKCRPLIAELICNRVPDSESDPL